MTLEKLNSLIDEFLSDGIQKRPGAMIQTNALNAEFALGKFFAILHIIEELYGIDAMIETKERTQATIDALTMRTQVLYGREKTA